MKNEATTGAINGRIGEKIAFDNPSSPNALLLSFQMMTSFLARKKSNQKRTGIVPWYFRESKFVLPVDNRDKNLYHFEAFLLVRSENKFPLACGRALR